MKSKRKQYPKNSGIRKLIFSILLSIIVFILCATFKMEITTRLILSWDVFSITMIFFTWIMFFHTNEKELCDVVESQDDGLKVIFSIVLIGVCFSLFGTILLLQGKQATSENKILHTIVSLSPVLFSWILLHTIFTVRYAHLYHDKKRLGTGSNTGGVAFPGNQEPDYVDFAYFSFVIGMTFQVSDVQINARAIRRFVLLHSIISFVFNTIIVALTINAIAGLTK